MNDKFSGQLRQHLLRTADERPADGQLAAIVERVAVTPQRHPLAARLTWAPGRFGPFPSTALRYGLIAAALLAMTGLAVFVGSQRPASTVFEGTWTTIDEADGSTMFLIVGEGTGPDVRFVDEFASGLACQDDAVKVFTADGTGTIDGSRLEISFPNGGGCGLETVGVPVGVLTHDEMTDTLVDGDRATWTRVRDDIAAPTPAPVPTAGVPTPTPSDPMVDADCIQFDAVGTYTNRADSLSLTATMPGTAAEPWHGTRSQFKVMKAACTDPYGTGAIDSVRLTRVYTDACDGTSVRVDTVPEAVAAVTAAEGLQVTGQTEGALGGYPGVRLDIEVPDVPNTCPDGQIRIADILDPFDPGVGYTTYLIDVDGTLLALALYGAPDWSPDVTAQVDAILASLQIAPPDPTYSSAVHGISMHYPADWQIRPATEPWTGGALTFDSPAADVIFDPAYGDGLYMMLASHDYGDGGRDAWRDETLAWLCSSDDVGGASGSWVADGADGFRRFCDATSAYILFSDWGEPWGTRGWLIALVASAEEPGLADTYDIDWLEVLFSTVDLRPSDALAAPSP